MFWLAGNCFLRYFGIRIGMLQVRDVGFSWASKLDALCVLFLRGLSFRFNMSRGWV